ncbi:MAG: acetate/propionate family kinase [Phycisphaeraceae bacterium]
MLVLVANLGSTSFKCKLFDLTDGSQRVLAHGAADRIGQGDSSWVVTRTGEEEHTLKGSQDLTDHAAAIKLQLDGLLRLKVIRSIRDLGAIGFKAVHGGPISGSVRVTDEVLETMEQFADVAPAHNPPYVAAMRAFRKMLPDTPQVAAFETGYHQTIPMARQIYAIPWEWTKELGIRRYGFHGASHRYIATRMGEIAPEAKRIISLHLGGSCSISAIEDGQSVGNSFGMTTQSGVFHNNRVGDFDAFAMLKLLRTGQSTESIFRRLGKEGGLLGISGVSPDMREVRESAEQGNERAKLAVDAFVESCRHYLGAYLVALGGADAIVFTGGIGQNNPWLREAVCQGLGFAGIELDAAKNDAAGGDAEHRLDQDGSRAGIWVLPTNEELIVARQTAEVLGESRGD